MLVNSVIAIGPSLDYYPLTPENNPKFMLSFLNQNMLQYTIRYLEPHSSKIFIFCIEEYKEMIDGLIKDFTCCIEVIATDGYEGMGFVLNMLKTRLTAEVFVLCKADMFFREDLGQAIERFNAFPKDDMHGSIFKTDCEETTMLMLYNGRLVAYDRVYAPRARCTMLATNTHRLKHLFIIRARMLSKIKITDFGFKRSIVPLIIRKNSFFKVFFDNNVVLYNIDDFFALQLEYKKLYVEGSPDVMLGSGCEVSGSARVIDSIVGNGCTVEDNCRVKGCVFMDGVVLQKGAIVINTIIGARTVVPAGSLLKKCKVANDYVFEAPVSAIGERFGYD
ncbi:hypothetical protein PAPHI01_0496 [Pancytospora philotis]|nr:hypothetical protein PAPHI01_0496 [Pancytospora philotis]